MKKHIKLISLSIFGLILGLGGLFWFSPAARELISQFISQENRAIAENDSKDANDEQKNETENETEDDKDKEQSVKLDDKQIETLGITIGELSPGTLNVTISTRGKIIIHPDCLVHVLPKVSGVAKEARKNVGDQIKQDEIIAVLESREIADTKSNYLAAMEKQKLALSQLDLETLLNEKKVSAKQDFLNAKSAYQETVINLNLARQKLRAFGLDDHEIDSLTNSNDPDLRLYEIRSPIEGSIINRHITKGEYIDETSTIYEIADLKNVCVEIGVFPSDLCQVSEGHVVDIIQPIDHLKSQAKIIYISPIIQDDTFATKAVALLPNPDKKWRPGTFVNVNICTEKIASEKLIPKGAIQNIDGTDVVFIRTAEGFEKRIVQTGKSDDDNIEIVSGLESGELFANSKTFILKADLLKSSVEDDD